jgi:hypothetical protein
MKHPATSRRTLLAGLAAAATPMGPALANATGGLPTSSPATAPDPILAVIAEHQAFGQMPWRPKRWPRPTRREEAAIAAIDAAFPLRIGHERGSHRGFKSNRHA